MRRWLKRTSACLLAGVLLLCFASCSQSSVKQLKEQTIVQGIGIDKKDDLFDVTFQVLDITKASGSSSDEEGTITITYNAKGKTISDAITNGQKVLDRDTFLAQNKIIVLSAEIAQQHMDQVLDFFVRSKNCRPDVQVAVTTDTAKEILESKCKNASIPAEKIQKTIINGEYNGKSMNRMIMNVVNDYMNPVSGVYLPVVKLFDKGDNVALSGVAVFSETGKTGYLTDRETRGILWTDNKVRNGNLVVETEKQGNVTLRIVKSSSRSHVTVENNRIVYHVSVKSYCNINEMENGLTSSMSQDDLKKIEKKAQSVVRAEIEAALEKCLREYQCDAFRIGRLLGQQEYGFYKEIKDHYQEELPFVTYDIKPEIEVKRLDNEALHH